MNVKIGRKIYDTEKSRLVAEKASGCYGDPAGFEERLYQKAKDDYFFFGQGGSTSPYPQPAIVPVTMAQASSWLVELSGAEAAAAEFPSAAPAPVKKATAKAAGAAAKKPVKAIKAEAGEAVKKAGRKSTGKT